ncbi:AsmA family protein [Photobacterium satsumensis]|uniref:AsmA family protein n=1 Tax=Photobacterium satsumensis TaxID=2910239 RepID=UPI003D110E6B
MKKIIMALLAVVVVAVIGIAALVALVDPNQFKPMIAEQVKKATGRDLVIEGDISWRFFPSIGFDIGKTEFKNPQGFAEPNLAQFDQAELSVSVMPLFSQQLEIGNVSLLGGRVFIQTLENGVSNLDGLSGQETTESTAESAETPTEPSVSGPAPTAEQQAWQISLAGVEISNASALIIDDKAGSQTEVDRLDFTLDQFAPGEWTAAQFDIAGSAGELSFSAEGQTELLIAEKLDGAELKALSLKASAKDAVNDIRNANISLDSFKLGDWSTIEFAIEGEVPDLSFNTQGSTKLMVDEAIKLISLKDAKLNTDVKGASLPRPEMAIALEADATYQLEKGLAELPRLKAAVDELALNGNASFQSADIPVIRFDLSSDKIDLDAFLGSEEKSTDSQGSGDATSSKAGSAESAGSAGGKATDQEPDLSVLKTLDLAGKLAIEQFKAANAHMSNVKLALSIKNGVLDLSGLDANLYQGSMHATAKIDANGQLPTYRVKKQIKGVQIQPLLMDVAQNDTLAGSGDISVNVSGTGLAEKRMRENIAGTIDIRFADGAIYGVNVPEMIREARATLKGQKAEYVKEEKKTDFSAMTATIKLGKGVASTSNLDIDSPLLRINGNGSTSLVNETIDFAVNTSVVATSKGQGGKDIDEVADLTVPIDVKGNWSEPAFSLNLAQLLKQNNELEKKAQREVERGLEKLLGDKAKDDDIKKAADKLLKGLFN